ncbi:hypothetical protein HDU78_009154 [Chytriomyces hyalinus]|nr:hypothetical protein HDU78_009154 [Chytriomyces hyalinus]
MEEVVASAKGMYPDDAPRQPNGDWNGDADAPYPAEIVVATHGSSGTDFDLVSDTSLQTQNDADVTIQSVFDFSAIMPNMTDPVDSLNKFKLRVLSAEIEAVQGNVVLRAKASVSYKNDFPVQFALPFVA